MVCFVKNIALEKALLKDGSWSVKQSWFALLRISLLKRQVESGSNVLLKCDFGKKGKGLFYVMEKFNFMEQRFMLNVIKLNE